MTCAKSVAEEESLLVDHEVSHGPVHPVPDDCLDVPQLALS